eukprot:9291894-Pyramimonas_sp.AAC.1
MGSSGAAGSCPGAPQPALWVGHCSLVGQLELLLRCAIPRRPYFPPEPVLRTGHINEYWTAA